MIRETFAAVYASAALWPTTPEIDGDRWVAIEPTSDHASFAEALLAVAPSLLGEPPAEPADDSPSWEDRAEWSRQTIAELTAAELAEVAEDLAEAADDGPFDWRRFERQDLDEMRVSTPAASWE